MRFIRSALITLTLAGTATLAGASTGFAQTTPVVTVTPNPARPGDHVVITVVCGPNATAATIKTGGGTFPMQRTAHPGAFVDVANLSLDFPPGPMTDIVLCSNGLSSVAEWSVVSPVTPSGAPKTGDGVTSTAVGGPFAAGGIALIGAGGLAAGAAAIRGRRRSGSPS